MSGLKQPLSVAQQADRAEIQARVLRHSNPALAEQQAEEAANLHQGEAAYHDMARHLPLPRGLLPVRGIRPKRMPCGHGPRRVQPHNLAA